MNPQDIHTALHSQAANEGPHAEPPASNNEDWIQIQVCAPDLARSATAWHTLAFSLIRLLKRIQGRTITGVRYTAALDKETNPDGAIGTLIIMLEPVS